MAATLPTTTATTTAASPRAPLLELSGVAKAYGPRPLLTRVDLTVPEGAFTVLFGAPSVGKSVAMRLVMGLEKPDAGTITLRGVDVTRFPAADRNIGYVPQSFALYPHYSVYDNIAYPLTLAKMPKREAAPIVERAAAMLKISDLVGKRPDQLSGGQKQRVAIARGIAKQTDLFILDDPLAGLDFKLREQLVDDLRQLQADSGSTFLYTTSDAIEALTLADELAVLAQGRVVEHGAPERLYDAPAHLDTMRLLGFPQATFLDGAVTERDGGRWCGAGPFDFPVAIGEDWVGRTLTVGIRPESLVLVNRPSAGAPVAARTSSGASPNGMSPNVASGHGARLRAEGRVLLREDLGGEEIVYLDVAGTPLTTVLRHDAAPDGVGETAEVSVDPRELLLFGPDGARVGAGGVDATRGASGTPAQMGAQPRG